MISSNVPYPIAFLLGIAPIPRSKLKRVRLGAPTAALLLTWVSWRVALMGVEVSRLAELVYPRNRPSRERAAWTIGSILYAIMRASVTWHSGYDGCVAGLLVGNYGVREGDDRFMPPYAVLRATLEALESHGVITVNRSFRHGVCSWVTPGPAFRATLEAADLEVAFDPQRGLVQVRDHEHRPLRELPRDMKAEAAFVRTQLAEINLAIPRLWMAAAVCDVSGLWRPIPHAAFVLHAVFNEDFRHGGRNYSLFQNEKANAEHVRETLRLHHKGRWRDLVEVDYVALHPGMVYDAVREPRVRSDMHNVDVPGWFDSADPCPIKRALLKTINNALFNIAKAGATEGETLTRVHRMAAKAYRKWKASVAREYWLPTRAPRVAKPAVNIVWELQDDETSNEIAGMTQVQFERAIGRRVGPVYKSAFVVAPKDIADALLASHPAAVRSKIFSNLGTRLQAIDGAIAREITLSFVRKGWPIIPIHDSFMVLPEHVKQLEDMMRRQYRMHFKADPLRKRIAKRRNDLPPVDIGLALETLAKRSEEAPVLTWRRWVDRRRAA